MILVDFSQTCIANLMMHVSLSSRTDVDIAVLRKMILTSLKSYRQKLRDYGKMVIAVDDRQSWRRDIFPYYKQNRKAARDASLLNWSAIYTDLATIEQEIADHFPYIVVHVPKAEGDDVIGTLARTPGQHVIVSKDKDFLQLHHKYNVKQYDPIGKMFLTSEHPTLELVVHIIRGDRIDGIPNVLSDDNTFAIKGRQKKITEKRLESLLEQSSDGVFEDPIVQRNWSRNRQLIDLSCTPKSIVEQVDNQINQEAKNRSKLPAYFAKHKLKDLLSAVSEF